MTSLKFFFFFANNINLKLADGIHRKPYNLKNIDKKYLYKSHLKSFNSLNRVIMLFIENEVVRYIIIKW
jgi:hypothetical protein